jgi:hypothetical protein
VNAGSMSASPSSYHSNSRCQSNECLRSPAVGASPLGAQSALALPPPAFPAGATATAPAAAAGGVMPLGSLHSCCLQQHKYSPNSRKGSSSSNVASPSCSGSSTPYGSAASISSQSLQLQQQQQQQQHGGRAEAFYSRRFADPLAGAWCCRCASEENIELVAP